MANEIQIIHDDAAEAVYCIIRNQAGAFWRTTGTPAFEVFAAANWAEYAIGLAEVEAAASGNVALQADFPATISAGFYWLDYYVRGGAAAARTDLKLGSELQEWQEGALMTPHAARKQELLAVGMLMLELTGVELFEASPGLAKIGDALIAGPYRFAGWHGGRPYFVSIVADGKLWWHAAALQWRVSIELDEAANYFWYAPVVNEMTYEPYMAEGTASGTFVVYVNPYVGNSAVQGDYVLSDLLNMLPARVYAAAPAATALSNATWTNAKAGFLDASILTGNTNAALAAGYTAPAAIRSAVGLAAANLDTQLDAIATNAGGGAWTVTITAEDEDGEPLQAAAVRLQINAEDYSATTNASGQASFGLGTAGTYTILASLAGYQYAGGTVAVSGDTTATIELTRSTVTPSSDPETTHATGLVLDGQGTPVADVTVNISLVVAPTASRRLYTTDEFSITSDANGLLDMTLLRSATYRLTTARMSSTFATDAEATYELPVTVITV